MPLHVFLNYGSMGRQVINGGIQNQISGTCSHVLYNFEKLISLGNISLQFLELAFMHGLRTPREEIAFTARLKIHSHSQIFRCGRSMSCLPHRFIFSDIFDLCLHSVSVVRAKNYCILLSSNTTAVTDACWQVPSRIVELKGWQFLIAGQSLLATLF